MKMSKDPYLIEMVSKEFKSDESETGKKKNTKVSFKLIHSTLIGLPWKQKPKLGTKIQNLGPTRFLVSKSKQKN